MQKYFILFSFFISIQFLAGQIKHEVTTDPFGLFDEIYVLNYEICLGDRFGLIFEGEYDLSSRSLSRFSADGLTTERFDSKSFSPGFGLRYYSSKDKSGEYHGFFFGPYISGRYLIDTEDEYFEKYEEYIGVPPDARVLEENVLKTISVGAHFGYKFLVEKHFVIEVRGTMLSFNTVGTQPDQGPQNGIDFELLFRTGYRL